MKSIWFRYFVTEIFKVFFLVILCFYFLYVLIDYSAHSKAFQSALFSEIFLYYGLHFAKQADLLFTVALLISSIKVLITFNLKNEIVALVASGLSLKRLLYPFFFAALCCMCFSYLNLQYIQPYALRKLENFEDQHFDHISEHSRKRVHALTLLDNTLLLYQFFDSSKQAFFDTYWIKNLDEIYKIQSLFPYEEIPKGVHVDVLTRMPDGAIVRKTTYPSALLPQLQFDKKALFSEIYPPSWQSFTQLVHQFPFQPLFFGKRKISDREAEAASAFFYKLFIPLVSLLAILGPAPFCLRFSRNLPVFLIFALSLFGLFAFYTVSNSCLILAENQVIPPFWGFFILFFLAFLICGKKYAKL